MSERSNSTTTAGLAESSTTFAQQLAAAVMRRIELPHFASASGSAANIRIGEVSLGQASVDHVDVFDTRTTFDTGNVFLADARALVEIQLSVRWWYDFWFASDSGTVSLGSVSFPFTVGNIAIPRLRNIRLEIPTASLDDITATLQPVVNLDLGGGTFENLALTDTVLPSAGFGLGGLGLGAVKLDGLEIPAASSAKLELGGFSPNGPLVLPSIRVDNLNLPSASAPRIESDGLISVPQATASQRVVPFSLGVIGFDFRMRPVLDFVIERLVIEDLSASASIAALEIRDIAAPLTIRDVQLDGLSLEQLTIDRITV